MDATLPHHPDAQGTLQHLCAMFEVPPLAPKSLNTWLTWKRKFRRKNCLVRSRKRSGTFGFTQGWVKLSVRVTRHTSTHLGAFSLWKPHVVLLCSCSDRLIVTWMRLHWNYFKAWSFLKCTFYVWMGRRRDGTKWQNLMLWVWDRVVYAAACIRWDKKCCTQCLLLQLYFCNFSKRHWSLSLFFRPPSILL